MESSRIDRKKKKSYKTPVGVTAKKNLKPVQKKTEEVEGNQTSNFHS